MGATVSQSNPKKYWNIILTLIVIFLIPSIPLFNIYQNNASYLLLNHILFVAMLFGFVALGAYGIGRWLFHCPVSGLFVSIAFVACLFLINHWLAGANQIAQWLGVHKLFGYAIMAVATLAVFWLLGAIGKKVPPQTSFFLLLMVFVLAIFNGFPIALNAFRTNNDRVEPKSDFVVSADTKSPNIYWFHMDGMLNPQTIQKYFGDSQEPYEQELTSRGFVSFAGASLEANHKTSFAIPALTCPDYYDRVLHSVLLSGSSAEKTAEAYSRAHPGELALSKKKNELLTAFLQKNYQTDLIGHIGDTYIGPCTKHYAVAQHITVSNVYATRFPYIIGKNDGANNENRSSLSILLGLLLSERVSQGLVDDLYPDVKDRIPLSSPSSQTETMDVLLYNEKAYFYYSSLVESLHDELKNATSPHFTLIHNMMPHGPYIFSLDNNQLPYPGNEYDVRNAPKHFAYCFSVQMNLVDMVLAGDPDAIIVLIGDHGIHAPFCEEQLLTLYGEDGRTDLWNNIFYAVRIPAQWDATPDMDVLVDPRNMSRYLVNTFVGPNYQYIEE